MKFFSNLFNFFLGFLLAISLLAGGAILAGRYVVAKLTAPPPKPIFANDKPAPKVTPSPKPVVRPVATSPEPEASPSPTLQAGTYRAKVVQPIGLVLRDTPSLQGSRLGGVEYNTRVIVLEETSDKQWQRIQVEGGRREGWVKGGNTEKLEDKPEGSN
ncbi:MAG: SH3 domain-containing protein [Leptolyngbyaceae cyanobacterium bins.59]|nr:SH3 domain-containing protein [Leptolyngbyaceae cyanobacterium bins.59]